MRINKMTTYAMRDIVRLYEEEETVVTTKLLSEKEHISQGVLMKVLFPLKKAGIVRSLQGRGNISGGFELAKSIKDVTIYDVVQIMEGDICLSNGLEDSRKMFQEVRRINDVLIEECSHYSMYDILNRD